MKQKVNTQILIKNYGIILVLLLSFWAVKPLFVDGFFTMHDDTQVARVFEMGKALQDGMFPVRWVPDLGYGYGYPIFNFYAPLAYYVGGLFIVLGFDAFIATKIMMGIGILLSGIFMYLLAREFWGEIGGVFSGLFYVYAPYHALDIYVRGDVAEFWAYAFIPLMFWGFYKVFDLPRRSPSAFAKASADKSVTSEVSSVWRWVIVGSLGYAGVILSHNLTAMMVTPFLAIVILLNCYIAYKNKKFLTTYYLLLSTFLGLALSAFYWIPALLEMKYTNVLSQIGGGADFRDHFVCINQLWESHWGFGGSAAGCIDGLSFKIGKLHLFMVFMGSIAGSIYYGFRHSGERSDSRISTSVRDSGQDGYQTGQYHSARPSPEPTGSGTVTRQARMTGFILLSILGFAISVFMMFERSKPIWEAVPAMAFFQYPWRFLLLASFFSSLVSGAVIWFLTIHLGGALRLASLRSGSPPRWAAGIGFAILIFLLIYFNSKLFQPQTIIAKTAFDYTNEYALKWTASKISDEFLPPNFKKPKSEREIAKRPAIPPQETQAQKIANAISLSGIAILTLGIIIKDRKRMSV